LKSPLDAAPQAAPLELLQVGALPLRFEDGDPLVMLVTSRGTRRWVIPKGWPMKGKKNWAAAAQEAKEEAGVIGKTYKQPVGDFRYFKRRAGHFDLCRVEVYVLNVEKHLAAYREKGQRQASWFPLDAAAELVEEPGLAALLQTIDVSGFYKPVKKKAGKSSARKR
jgi:8-oxo-dGTP pyrophosphatase MutT (NUDIX family)